METNVKKIPHVEFWKIIYGWMLYFDLRPGPKILFQGNTPEGIDTFQRPVIERDRVGGLRLMIWDKVKVPSCHYSHAPEESNLWTAWQLSHANPWTTLSNPCNKVRGKYNWKEVFLRLPSCVLPSCVLPSMRLNYGVVVMLNERVNKYITRWFLRKTKMSLSVPFSPWLRCIIIF